MDGWMDDFKDRVEDRRKEKRSEKDAININRFQRSSCIALHAQLFMKASLGTLVQSRTTRIYIYISISLSLFVCALRSNRYVIIGRVNVSSVGEICKFSLPFSLSLLEFWKDGWRDARSKS